MQRLYADIGTVARRQPGRLRAGTGVAGTTSCGTLASTAPAIKERASASSGDALPIAFPSHTSRNGKSDTFKDRPCGKEAV